MYDEKQIANLMNALQCSRDEAIEVIEYDKQVDKMTMKELNADLTTEQKKVRKEMTQADRKPTVYQFKTRQRKADEPKRELIQILADTITPIAENMNITNPEREINFMFGGRKYKIVLSAPRS